MLVTKTVEEAVVDAICFSQALSPSEVKMECNLEKDLGVDSLDRLQITFEIEQALRITIPSQNPRAQTVQELISLVKRITADEIFFVKPLVH